MVEEGTIAFLHLSEIPLGRVVAHARPRLAFRAAFNLIVPRPGLGFALDQPIGHSRLRFYDASAPTGRTNSDSMAVCTLVRCSTIPATAFTIGISTPFACAISASACAV